MSIFSGCRRRLPALLSAGFVLAVLAGVLAVAGDPAPAGAAPACGVLQSGAAAPANTAVNKACGLIGTPYAWGGGHGTSPGISWGVCDASNGAPNDCHVRGLDCSGMVRYAYYLAVGADVISGPTWVQWASSRVVARFYRSSGAPVFSSATSTTQTGTLNQGTNYVYCRAWGREIRDSGGSLNHWWLKTDPDVGPANQWVSAYT